MSLGVYAAYFCREELTRIVVAEMDNFGLEHPDTVVGKANILFQERIIGASTVKCDGGAQNLRDQIDHRHKHYLIPTGSTLPHSDFIWEFRLEMLKVDKANPSVQVKKTVSIFWKKKNVDHIPSIKWSTLNDIQMPVILEWLKLLKSGYTFDASPSKPVSIEMKSHLHPMTYGLNSWEHTKVLEAKSALAELQEPVKLRETILDLESDDDESSV
ncbi:MAG: hypothetical protein P0S95_01860 [Rhabdochlamydiaceae bacterium]|nr:hypothetical protein [Candidatus Amphrikana amoebophyrae]